MNKKQTNFYDIIDRLNKNDIVYKVKQDKQIEPKLYQIRKLNNHADIYLALIDEIVHDRITLYVCIVLTRDKIALIDKETPTINNELIACPIWTYLDDSFLKDYTISIMQIDKEIANKLYEYALNMSIEHKQKTITAYFKYLMRYMAKYNTSAIVKFLDIIER